MTAEETNKYFDIYENYVEDLIRLDGNNPICYVRSTRTIQDQMDNYVIGSLWPRCSRVLKNAVRGLECLV